MAQESPAEQVVEARRSSKLFGRSSSLSKDGILRPLKKSLGSSLSTSVRGASTSLTQRRPELCDTCYQTVYAGDAGLRKRRATAHGQMMGLTVAQMSQCIPEACELCRALSHMPVALQHLKCPIPELERAGEFPGNQLELREFPLIEDGPFLKDGVPPVRLASFVALVPWHFGVHRADRETSRRALDDAALRTGYLMCHRKGEEEHPQLLFARKVSARFDPQIVAGWLSCCEKHHEACRSLEDQGPTPGFRFIDCQARRVVDGSSIGSRTQYVALSYVWGQKSRKPARPSSSVNDGDLAPWAVPPVINDAIEATAMLGFRYLWVDKYCISQQSNAERHKQILHMDTVYTDAALTIIAAAGVDERAGLPGISTSRSCEQTCIETNELKIISTLPSPVYEIAESRWASRGWTYQEATLSRRRLVFTKDQLYFECNSMHCYESLGGSESLDLSLYQDFARPRLFALKAHHAAVPMYIACAEEYTKRALTFDADSLNAFAGIIRRLEKSASPPVRHIWGIPFLQWKDTAHFLQLLACGLSWRHPVSPDHWARRRKGFPSWSWAGWAGPVVWPSRYHYHAMVGNAIARDIGTVRVQLEDGTITDIADLDYNTDNHTIRHPRALFIDAMKFRPGFFILDGHGDLALAAGASLRFYPSKEDLTPEKAVKRLQSGRYEAFRLATVEDEVLILLIKKYRSSYYRIGLMTAKTFSINPAQMESRLKTYKLK